MSKVGTPPGRRGLLLIVSSPSGAGKTTLTRLLLAEDKEIHLSVSVTTRPKRPSEVDHVHYRFIDAGSFEAMRERGELLESAKVHGNYYGTPAAAAEQLLVVQWGAAWIDVSRKIVEAYSKDTGDKIAWELHAGGARQGLFFFEKIE